MNVNCGVYGWKDICAGHVHYKPLCGSKSIQEGIFCLGSLCKVKEKKREREKSWK